MELYVWACWDDEDIIFVLDVSNSGGALNMSYAMLKGVHWNLGIVASIVACGNFRVWV